MKHALIMLVLLLAATGCESIRPKPSLRHVPIDVVKTGEPYTVVVRTWRVQPEMRVEGKTYYRLPGKSRYSSRAMDRRAGELWATIPSQRVRDGESIEYFVDVTIDENNHTLGSAAEPYRVRYIDAAKYAARDLSIGEQYTRAMLPLRFVLTVGDSGATEAELTYERPGMPAPITVPMTRRVDDTLVLDIPATRVSAGPWRYFVTVRVDGKPWRLPEQGWRTLTVPGG